jgi:hypothetical protein
MAPFQQLKAVVSLACLEAKSDCLESKEPMASTQGKLMKRQYFSLSHWSGIHCKSVVVIPWAVVGSL